MNEGQKYFPPPPEFYDSSLWGIWGKFPYLMTMLNLAIFFPPTNDYRDENATSMVVTPRKR